MGAFAAQDHPHPRRPAIEIEQSRDLSDFPALSDLTIGLQRRRPGPDGQFGDGVAHVLPDGEPHAVVQAAASDLALRMEPVQQLVRGAGTVAADQQVPAIRHRDLSDRLSQDLDVIDCRVRACPACPQRGGEELPGVVAPHTDRVIPEGSFERRRRQLLLRVGHHDRGIDIQHDRLSEIGPGDLRSQNPASGCQLGPHVAPDPGPGPWRSSSAWRR